MSTVLVTGRRLFMKYSEMDYISERAAEVDAEIVAVREEEDPPLIEAAKDARAIVTIGRRVGRDVIEVARDLQLIQMLSVGYDCIDVAAATERRPPTTASRSRAGCPPSWRVRRRRPSPGWRSPSI